MQDALRHAQVAVERDTAGDPAGAATEYAAAAAALLRLAETNAAQKEALEGRAAEYSARATALREIDAISSLPQPPTTTAAPSLEQRLDRLKGPQVQVDEAGLEARLARLTGEPVPEPAPAPGGGAMSAGDAQRYEQDARAALGLGGHGAGGGDSEVDRLLADAVAANADAHRTGARIDGGLDADEEAGGEIAGVLAAARDLARLEAKYGPAPAPQPPADAAKTADGGAPAAAGAGDAPPADVVHSSDDEDDDVAVALKRWLRGLGLGAYIDHIAAFAHDMEEINWVTKDQVALLPMSAAERTSPRRRDGPGSITAVAEPCCGAGAGEKLLVAIARLPPS